MQFKLVPNPTFKIQVNLSVPDQKSTASVEFEFKYKNSDEYDAWFKKYKSRPTAEALADVVAGWGVLGADDQPTEVSLDNMTALLKNYPASGREILEAYYKALRESRAKN